MERLRTRAIGLIVMTLAAIGPMNADASAQSEPSYEQAVARWPDLRRPIIFLGCKDHTDEFAVMWNGNLSMNSAALCDADRLLFKDRADDSLQVSFSIGPKPDFTNRESEDGLSEPSLLNGYQAITRIRLKEDGAIVLQEAFASDERGSGGAANPSAPVFLRVRFTVEQTGSAASPLRLWAQLSKNHISYSMGTRRNVRIQQIAPLYGRKLHMEERDLIDTKGLVRMAADQDFHFYSDLPENLNSFALREFQLDKNLCEFTLARRSGALLELTFPFLPVPAAKIAAVQSREYSRARDGVAEGA